MPLTLRDPLGLSQDQRASAGSPSEDSLRELTQQFMDQVRRNLEYLNSAPAGTMIDTGCSCGQGHPIEMYR